jgi:hypothetical protein
MSRTLSQVDDDLQIVERALPHLIPVGMAGPTAPAGWRLCDGDILSVMEYMPLCFKSLE